MFLQSYIYRATQTLYGVLYNPEVFIDSCKENPEESLKILRAGITDLATCTRLYRGSTRAGDKIEGVRDMRNMMGSLHDALTPLKYLLSTYIQCAEAGTPLNYAELLSSLKGVNRKLFAHATMRMQRASWDTWEEARALWNKGFYPFPGFCEKVHMPSGSAKHAASYFQLEGIALLTSVCPSFYDSNAVIRMNNRVKWYKGKEEFAQADANDKSGYMEIFHADLPEQYTAKVVDYWGYIYKNN